MSNVYPHGSCSERKTSSWEKFEQDNLAGERVTYQYTAEIRQ